MICFGMTFTVLSQNAFSGQSSVSESEEQYSRSQTVRGEAITAFRAGDLATALDLMKRALIDRPTNTALLSNALFLAAETGSIDDATNFANQFIALELVPGAGIRAKMQEKLPAATWQQFSKKFDALVQPKGTAEKILSISTDHKLVEGVATDGNGAYFLSTVVSNAILVASPTGEISVLTSGTDHAIGSFFGIAYSQQEKALYATHGRVDQTRNMPKGEGQTGVIRIDPRSGDVTGDWPLPGGTEDQQIADITISPDGAVFVSEAQSGAVYKIDGEKLDKLNTDKQYRSPQGMAILENGVIFMADYGRGLWRINTITNEATLLPVPSTVSLIGIDGLLAHRGRLIAIQNGVSPQRVIEIELDGTREAVIGIRVLAQSLADFNEPTLGASTPEGLVFVASSQWPKYAPDGFLIKDQSLNPTSILLLRD